MAIFNVPPDVATRFHITRLVNRTPGYEHRCPPAPQGKPKIGLRVLFVGEQSPSWFLYKSGTREYIAHCPWCGVKLPALAEIACTCGADTVVDHTGYHDILVRKDFEALPGTYVSLRARARVVEFIHEDLCPVRGMRTRGSY